MKIFDPKIFLLILIFLAFAGAALSGAFCSRAMASSMSVGGSTTYRTCTASAAARLPSIQSSLSPRVNASAVYVVRPHTHTLLVVGVHFGSFILELLKFAARCRVPENERSYRVRVELVIAASL